MSQCPTRLPSVKFTSFAAQEKIDPKLLITHRFKFDGILDAYETFGHAADTRALKVLLEAE